jgi:uncharacterized protein YjiS (DUF1127 family)
MESSSAYRGRRPQDYPGYAIAEILAELIAAGWRALLRWSDKAAQASRRARARRELHRLSDHYLRDIGLERGDIDRLFG